MITAVRPLAASLLALIVLVSPGFAVGGVDVIKVKGQIYRGDATNWDPVAEVLSFVTEDGVEHQIPAADLDRLSAYKLAKAKVDRKDAGKLIELGNFSRTIELFVYASQQYDAALKVDPGVAEAVEKERATNRRLAAEYCMHHAQLAIDAKNAHGAEKWLTRLVEKLPNEPLAAEAASILAEYYRKNHEAKDDALEQKHAKKLESSLAVAKKHYDSMLKKIEEGLTTTRSTSISRRQFEAAWTDGDRALKSLDKTEKKLGRGDPDLAELLDGYRDLVTEHMVASQLHLASSYSVQTSYQKALRTVNKALSVAPNDQKALAARARIENAAATGGWW